MSFYNNFNRLISFKKKTKQRRAPNSIDHLNLAELPILDADSLIGLLGQHATLRTIRSMTALEINAFNDFYTPAIHAFCECAQLIPASESHHHTQPGGLIIHTLSVIENALTIRNRYILPLFSDPEQQAAERHLWTYAVFAGALLHDAGKMITQQAIILNHDNGLRHTAYGQSVLDSDADSYFIQFTPSDKNWRLHQQLASTFFYLLPVTMRSWLAQHVPILGELSAWLAGDQDNWGSIGDIVRQADSRSVADSLGLFNAIRFPGANPPLGEMLMIALRQILSSLGVNKPGAAIFKQGSYTWIMSKTLADNVRTHLQQNGETRIPSENTRIFDELGQMGFADTDQQGKAVWHIVVTSHDKGFIQPFSVLRFETRRLYHSTNEPTDWTGTIETVTDSKNSDKTVTTPKQVMQSAPVSTAQSKPASPSTQYLAQQHKDDQKTVAVSKPIESDANLITQHNTVTAPQPINTGSEHMVFLEGYESSNDGDITIVEDANPPKLGTIQANLPNPPTSLDDPELGACFVEWLRHAIATRKYVINHNSSPLHLLADNLLGALSPSTFKKFCAEYDLTSDDPKKFAHLKVQSAVSKLKQNVKFGKKDVRFYRIINQKGSRLCFYLFPATHLISDEILATLNINKTLEPIEVSTDA